MLSLIGFASGFAAGNEGCEDGPISLQENGVLKDIQHTWKDILRPMNPVTDKFVATRDICERLAKTIAKQVYSNKTIVIGGDHSSAIGTWSGAAQKAREFGHKMGLIWIDAHMDAHTYQTSESGNIHGMPLAALLGYGDESLTTVFTKYPKLDPRCVCLIGIRSYEEGEKKLLEKLGIKVYTSKEVQSKGMYNVLGEAIQRLLPLVNVWGLSVDLDAMDPSQVKGVGTPEVDGIDTRDFLNSLAVLKKNPPFLSEIVEYNPHLDSHNLTGKFLRDIVKLLASY